MVKFYYDHKIHWVTDNFNTLIVVAMGDFQTQLGCVKDNDASCLRSWLEDPENSGTFSFTTRVNQEGEYSVAWHSMKIQKTHLMFLNHSPSPMMVMKFILDMIP